MAMVMGEVQRLPDAADAANNRIELLQQTIHAVARDMETRQDAIRQALHVNLGETAKAREQLALAIEHSTARKDSDLYSAKLARLQGAAVH